MGQRDAGISAATGSGGNAGHYLAIDVALQQVLQLFGTPAENERIAALEPYHPLALVGQIHQQLVDLLLGQTVATTGLADVVPSAGQRDQREQFRADQAVVDHGVGLHQQAPGAQGQQARIAGAGADQGDFARSEQGLECCR
ncbi:hypothetical protein D3C73_1077040 [compost metagenome]